MLKPSCSTCANRSTTARSWTAWKSSGRDDKTLEASLPKQKSLNTLFSELERQGIHVLSMRNKANRLEELFMALVDKGQAQGGKAA